jgi:hypothetical protein
MESESSEGLKEEGEVWCLGCILLLKEKEEEEEERVDCLSCLGIAQRCHPPGAATQNLQANQFHKGTTATPVASKYRQSLYRVHRIRCPMLLPVPPPLIPAKKGVPLITASKMYCRFATNPPLLPPRRSEPESHRRPPSVDLRLNLPTVGVPLWLPTAVQRHGPL